MIKNIGKNKQELHILSIKFYQMKSLQSWLDDRKHIFDPRIVNYTMLRFWSLPFAYENMFYTPAFKNYLSLIFHIII